MSETYQPPTTTQDLATPPRATQTLPAGTILTSNAVTSTSSNTPAKDIIGKRLLVPVGPEDWITKAMVGDVPHGLQPGEALVTVPIPHAAAELATPGAVVQLIHSAADNAIFAESTSQRRVSPAPVVLAPRAVIVSAKAQTSKSGSSWTNTSRTTLEVLVKISVKEAQKIASVPKKASLHVIFVT